MKNVLIGQRNRTKVKGSSNMWNYSSDVGPFKSLRKIFRIVDQNNSRYRMCMYVSK